MHQRIALAQHLLEFALAPAAVKRRAMKLRQPSKPAPIDSPTAMPVFITSSRAKRSRMPGATGSVRPSSPPQSCTTSVMLLRSSRSISRSK